MSPKHALCSQSAQRDIRVECQTASDPRNPETVNTSITIRNSLPGADFTAQFFPGRITRER
jgi:hypothetical protein